MHLGQPHAATTSSSDPTQHVHPPRQRQPVRRERERRQRRRALLRERRRWTTSSARFRCRGSTCSVFQTRCTCTVHGRRWFHPRRSSRFNFADEPLGAAEPEVRPHGERRIRQDRQPHRAGERADHRAPVRRHAELRLQGLPEGTETQVRHAGSKQAVRRSDGLPAQRLTQFAPGDIMQCVERRTTCSG